GRRRARAEAPPVAACCAATKLAPVAPPESRGRTHGRGPRAERSAAGKPGLWPKHLLTQWFDRHAPSSYLRGAPRGQNGRRSIRGRTCRRRRAIGASSAYNEVARGPSARHRLRGAQRFEPETTAMLNSLDVEGSPRDTRVVVAMSGGVDSSVTAALLPAGRVDVRRLPLHP